MPVDVARVSRVVNNVVSTASDVIRKHPIHYLDDLVILKIEETLFRVEKSLLCQFDAFRVMFESASEYLKDIDEGSTDKNPIILQGLTAVEMESLLRVINARWLKGVPEVDPQQWKAVIHLATMWEHEQLRQFAIDKIDELGLSSIELLALGTKCRVGKWLKPALVEMYLRPSPLGLDEAERLGISFFVELTKIREGCLTISSINSSCRTCGREYKGNRRSSSGDVHWPVGWGLSSPAHKRLRETRYCCCKNGWDPRKEATAQNMVQSLIDSGLQPFLEDAKSRNPEQPLCSRYSTNTYGGAYVTYRVEQTLFRTQELVLRRFRGLAGLLRGKDPNEVHILEGVTESEMAATLDILEARWFQGSPDFNFNQWKGALWVATLWNFEMLRDLSIRKIEDMKPPPLEILPLAKKCNVTRLFSMAYIDLCMRSTPITAEEGELLGYRRFADLVSIRESRKRQPCSECRNWSISITCVSCVESARETVGVAIMKLPVTPAVGITE